MTGKLKSDDFYGIDAQSLCWVVSLTRRGERLVKAFTFTLYGGREPALRAAQIWRDHVVREHPPILRRDRAVKLTRANKTGVAGVFAVYRPDGTLERWTVKTNLGGGKVLNKSFSVKRYGEKKGKALAVAERQRQLEQLEGHYIRHPASDPDTLPATPVEPVVQPLMNRAEVVRRDHRSGVVGVFCKFNPDGTPLAWIAKTQLEPGHTLTVRFPIKKYGDQSFAMAVAERKKQLALALSKRVVVVP